MMEYIIEPQKRLQVCEEVDLCVIGGSCAGLFAAVRAAGVAAYCCLDGDAPVQKADSDRIRSLLKAGGSLIF